MSLIVTLGLQDTEEAIILGTEQGKDRLGWRGEREGRIEGREREERRRGEERGRGGEREGRGGGEGSL